MIGRTFGLAGGVAGVTGCGLTGAGFTTAGGFTGSGLPVTGLRGLMRCIGGPPLPGGMGSTDPAETPIPYPGEPGPGGTKYLRRTSSGPWSNVAPCFSLSICNLIDRGIIGNEY